MSPKPHVVSASDEDNNQCAPFKNHHVTASQPITTPFAVMPQSLQGGRHTDGGGGKVSGCATYPKKKAIQVLVPLLLN